VFALFATQPGSMAALLVVIFCAITTFAPLKFLHPVRVARLRPLNLAVFALWSVLGLVSLASAFAPPAIVTAGIVVSSLYLLLVGVVLQGLDRLTNRKEGERV
jgi:phosphatidylcholine synthase